MSGTIIIRPSTANLTHDTAWVGTMSPYIVFKLGDQVVKTADCINGGRNPNWTGQVVELRRTHHHELEVSLVDDGLMLDHPIGHTRIFLNDALASGFFNAAVELFYKGAPAGEISLGMEYIADGY